MNDELDFREFLGLYNLMDIKKKLFEFTLYNPDSERWTPSARRRRRRKVWRWKVE